MTFPVFKAGDAFLRGTGGGFDFHTPPPLFVSIYGALPMVFSSSAARLPRNGGDWLTISQDFAAAKPCYSLDRTYMTNRLKRTIREKWRLTSLSNKVITVATVVIAISGAFTFGAAVFQWLEMKIAEKQTDKLIGLSKTSADIARDALTLNERPWVKIKHRIVQPLTFGVARWQGPIASIVVEDMLENVGPTVALNVFSWEDVLPMDPDGRYQTALARRTQWCDANRHPDANRLTGYMLFPHDPSIQQSSIGPLMEAVNKAADANSDGLHGKVGFVLVGCVVYRSSFEPTTNPTHQTKFIYFLAEPTADGGARPYVAPRGAAEKLQLIQFPDGFSAD